ncbi:hypothetical protein [Burkholderia multivorans]|jgi:DNA-binding phage protein|uniref:hypothetical protein n=1 Tax=Burkholderia multivorans TaxID=87883 RepID=UPI0012DD0AB3|nr:hypothetical protein [Burkholderia multivorans]MBU9347641.1 hypothetical protein [Burkholderia multivorans]MBU9443912.1 hypothetical protein [Burkholderia multivorans]QGR87363.1 hypothetical protein FOC34_19355 [Burkholderia multivorans]
MNDRSHDDAMAAVFREDPAYAVDLLNSILEDGAQGELQIVLRQMTMAFGHAPEVAEKASMSKPSIPGS